MARVVGLAPSRPPPRAAPSRGVSGRRGPPRVVRARVAATLDASTNRTTIASSFRPRLGALAPPARRRRRPCAVAAAAAAAASASSPDDASSSSPTSFPDDASGDEVAVDRKLELAAIVAFAVPLLATNIVTPLLTMTDTAFVGRCAADATIQLAALGVSTPLTDYTVTLAAFIPAGLTNIISNGEARGESSASLGAKTYGALLVSLALSLAVALVLNLCPETLLAMLNTPTAVMATATAYTKVRSIGMPAAYLTAAAYAVLVARKDTTSPLACVCLAAVVNVLGDYVAVAVYGGGSVGAAWATTAALYAGCVAILWTLKKKGYADHFPWGTLRWKEQLAPVMAFAGPITFLVFALLSIYTALILFANALGVTVSAAHRVAGNVFAVAVLCGDPLIQAGQAFMPKHLLPEAPSRRNARRMAGLLQSVGVAVGAFASVACGAFCLFGGGAFTRDAAVIGQLRDVTVPVCAAVFTNIVSKSMYGVTVAAKQLGFLAAITGVGLAFFAWALKWMNANLVGSALYFWMWWVVAGYYALAIVAIQLKSFGFPGVSEGMFSRKVGGGGGGGGEAVAAPS